MTHTYKLRYDFSPEVGEFQMDEAGEKGLTDAIFYVSLLFPDDGSYSQALFSIDGRNKGKPLSDKDIFKVWLMLSAQLKDSETLSRNKKEFVTAVFKTFTGALETGVKDD